MAEIFDVYEEELQTAMSELRGIVNRMRGGEASAGEGFDGKLQSAMGLLKELEIEVRSMGNASARHEGTEKVKVFRDQLTAIRNEFKSANFEGEKASLGVGRSADDRRRVLDTRQKVEQQNETLERLTRTIVETTELGTETAEELARNRERIESSRANAQEVNEMADKSESILKRMIKRDWSFGFLS